MKIFVDISELFVRHVGVDLSGGDVGVAAGIALKRPIAYHNHYGRVRND